MGGEGWSFPRIFSPGVPELKNSLSAGGGGGGGSRAFFFTVAKSSATTYHPEKTLLFVLYLASAIIGRGQDAESNLVNPHSFRNLSAYSWKIPLTVFIPSGLIPRTLLQSIQREQWFAHFSASDADRMPKWHNLLPQPFLILSAL